MLHTNFRKLQKLIIIYLVLITTSYTISAQVNITFPTERAIFQRHLDNTGQITLQGFTSNYYDSLICILEERTSAKTFRQKIQYQANIGSFSDKINGEGGWYKLKIRAYAGGIIKDSTFLERVGLGEVFIIAGQSNAQGVANTNASGATDDRVTTVNYQNVNSSYQAPEGFQFVQLGQNVNVGINGVGPWCWGELGDSLASNHNVPILFINTARQGTLSYNWWQSLQNIYTLDPQTYTYFPLGFPYFNLKLALKYFASQYGIRAVLWHQGESDVNPGLPNRAETFKHLKGIIDQSRIDFETELPWMVSRVSYVYGQTNTDILGAQNDIINLPNYNVFSGPFTDPLMIPRIDGVHFGNTTNVRGLGILAAEWLKHLNASFLNLAKPILAKQTIGLNLNCNNNDIAVSIPNEYNIYKWNNGLVSTSISATSGVVYPLVTDNNAKYLQLAPVNLDLIKKSPPLSLTASATLVCPEDSATLQAEKNWDKIVWNNGKTGETISVRDTLSYTYAATNAAGCVYNALSIMKINKVEPPASAKIKILGENYQTNADGHIVICDGDLLAIGANNVFSKINWNTGDTTSTIEINKPQNYTYSYEYSTLNCKAKATDSLVLQLAPLPQQPTILRELIYELKGTPITENEAYEWFYNESKIDSAKNNGLRIVNKGNYGLRIFRNDSLNCKSPIFELSVDDFPIDEQIVFYPNPAEEYLQVEFKENTKIIAVELIDVSGKKNSLPIIKNHAYNQLQINLEGVEAGQYLLKVQTDKTIITRKLIKH